MNKFLTTKKNIFSSLIQNYRIYMFDFRNNRAQRTSSLSLDCLSDLKNLEGGEQPFHGDLGGRHCNRQRGDFRNSGGSATLRKSPDFFQNFPEFSHFWHLEGGRGGGQTDPLVGIYPLIFLYAAFLWSSDWTDWTLDFLQVYKLKWLPFVSKFFFMGLSTQTAGNFLPKDLMNSPPPHP